MFIPHYTTLNIKPIFIHETELIVGLKNLHLKKFKFKTR